MSEKEKNQLQSKILGHYQTLKITSEAEQQKLQEVITGCSSLEVMTVKELGLLEEVLGDLALEPERKRMQTIKYLVTLRKEE